MAEGNKTPEPDVGELHVRVEGALVNRHFHLGDFHEEVYYSPRKQREVQVLYYFNDLRIVIKWL